MADHDDREPSSPLDRAEGERLPRVVSLVGRSRRARPGEAPPDETEDEAERRERAELEEEIAGLARDVERGEPGARDKLTKARHLHAMGTYLLGDHDAAFAEWKEIIDDDPAPPSMLLARALFHDAAGDTGAAVADYERAAQLAPRDVEIYLLRGKCHLGRRDHERAAIDFRRVIHSRPRDPTAYIGLAKSLTGRGDHDAAIRVCGRAIKIAPWRADLYELRASCFRSLNAWTEARADYDECLTRAPDNVWALRMRAMLHGFARDHDRELEDLSRAIALDPDHSSTLHSRALIYKSRGELELAITDYTRGLAHHPESPDVYLVGRGEAHLKLGALDAAFDDFSRAIELRDYSEAKAFWLRGHVHRKRGDAERAHADYSSALRIDEKLEEHLRWWERAHRGSKRNAELLDHLDVLLILDPSDVERLAERAALHAAAGEREKALADLDRALALDDRRDDLHHRRAGVLASMGEGEKAVEAGSHAIALAPYVPEYHAWRGYYRVLVEGPSEGAEADVLRAVELAPEDLTALFVHAAYLEQAERYEEAVRVYDRRIAIEPRLGLAYFQRGEARLHVGDDEAALRASLADFDKAIELEDDDPDLPEARARLLVRLGEMP
jgi:tetratricopeptide (TPR) repeat protein